MIRRHARSTTSRSYLRQVWLRYILAICCLALLAACGSQQRVEPTAAPTAAATTTPAGAPATAVATPTPGPGEFTNPVIDRDFPDPDVLRVDDTYYAYATNSGTTRQNIQTARSTDLVHWEFVGDTLPAPPTWAALNFGFIWAPEVTTWDGGETFVMYFTARDAASDRQCIGVATSTTPDGVFQPVGDQPFICQVEIGGSIDASAFKDDDGQNYLLWKNDGNCCGDPVHIYIQPVSEDGLTLEGEPTQLITNDQAWERNLVEAPTLWKHNDSYYLFYSANSYAGPDYAIGYAVADSVTGPYTKPSDEPFLATDYDGGAAIGPGGQDIVLDDDGETWMLYHSWDPSGAYRRMQIDELVWEGDTPVLLGPDLGPQPMP